MTPQERLRIDLLAARYLEAIERDDHNTLDQLWNLAETDAELRQAFEEADAGLLDEMSERERGTVEREVVAAVEKHLPSAEIVRPEVGAITVAEVANELFRHPPSRLTLDDYALNEQLRTAMQELPATLGLSKLTAWAEAIFGKAALEYWKAFQQAAIRLEARRSANVEYQLAARKAPKSEGS